MLRRTRRATAGLVMVGLAAWCGAAEKDTVPVGAFLLRWARMMELPLPEDAGPTEAVAELEQRGRLAEKVDLERPLTEGDVARLLGGAGIRLTTLNADRPLPAGKVDALFARFGKILAGGDGAGLVFSRGQNRNK